MKIELEKIIRFGKYKLCKSRYGICSLVLNDSSKTVLAAYENEKIMMEKLDSIINIYEESNKVI